MPDQRQLVVNNFQKATLPLYLTVLTHSGSGECLTVNVIKKGECSSSNSIEKGECSTTNDTDMEGCSTSGSVGNVQPFAVRAPSHRLHISTEDSGITTISLVTLEGMWAKADKLHLQEATRRPHGTFLHPDSSSPCPEQVRWAILM